MPRILEDELFERVQHISGRNKKAPTRARGKEEYLLTTKLFSISVPKALYKSKP